MSREDMEKLMDAEAYKYCARMENPNVQVAESEKGWKRFHQNLLKLEAKQKA